MTKKTSKRKQTNPLSMKSLIGFAKVLKAWKDSIEKGLDTVHPGWREGKANIMDMSDGYKEEYQTLRLLQALQVSMLDRMEMTYMLQGGK